MSVNVYRDRLQHASLFGINVLCTNWLIDRNHVPATWYCYDLECVPKRSGTTGSLVDEARLDLHHKSILSPVPLKRPGVKARKVEGDFYLHGEEMTLEEYCEEHSLEFPADHPAISLRPACREDAGLFYSDSAQSEVSRTIEQPSKLVGRITFANGETLAFRDADTYLQAIREELPYLSTTGFRCETLTDNPQVRKAVDDILLDFAGEENPRRTCNYGLTEAGKQALRDAADPCRPHTYAWFVLTDCNTPDEQIHQGLTLEEAIRFYQNSNRPEKRLGVTKDGIATVDLVRSLNGEQQFFEDYRRLDSFRDDPVVIAAAETLHQALKHTTPEQGMTLGGM